MSFKKAINQTAYTPEFKCSCTYTISSLSKERSCCDFAAALSRCGAGGQDTSLGSDLWSMSGRPRAGNKDVLSGPQCRSQTNQKKAKFQPLAHHFTLLGSRYQLILLSPWTQICLMWHRHAGLLEGRVGLAQLHGSSALGLGPHYQCSFSLTRKIKYGELSTAHFKK